jgi:acyl-CoA synthetase (AMP-forming)/AMP-acid ligase II
LQSLRLGTPHLPTTHQLLSHVDLMAASLQGIGVGRHDRVAGVLPNGLEMTVAFLAVSRRAIFAPLNPACRENEFDFYLSDLEAKALIVQSGIDTPAISVARRLGIRVIELPHQLEIKTSLSHR